MIYIAEIPVIDAVIVLMRMTGVSERQSLSYLMSGLAVDLSGSSGKMALPQRAKAH